MPLKFKMFPEPEALPHEFSGAPQMWVILLRTNEEQGESYPKSKS